MIRFALIAASVLGFALTAALGNLMVPLLRELQRTMRGAQTEQETDRKEPEEPVPTIGGLCLMVGTLAAVGAGWLAACAAQPSLLGSDRQMMSRLLIALLGTFAFGAVGVADDLACIRSRSALGMRRAPRLALEAAAAALVLGLLALSGCLPAGLVLPGAGYIRFAPASAAGNTASGNHPSCVSSIIRPSMATKAVPHTVPSAPSATRAASAAFRS